MSTRYLVGLGTNVDPHRNLAAALLRLQGLFGSLEVSRIRETAPVGPMRDRFLNAVLLLRTTTPRSRLKEAFCRLEVEFGRDRSHPDRALRDRPLDIDILAELSPDTTEVMPSLLPLEPYLRPSALELIHVLGLDCKVPTETMGSATSVHLSGMQVGMAPFTLHQGAFEPGVTATNRKAALVTGGAVRLGKEIALTLAEAGYDIALHYNSSAREAEKTAEMCRSSGVRCEVFKGEFMDVTCLPVLMKAVASRFPHLELLVNSASVYEAGSISQTTPEMLDTQWSVNFRAPFLLMKEFQAVVGHGTIINVLDNKIAFNQFQYAAYLTAKKALADVTKMAALEFAPTIRVNGIAPGVIMPGNDRDQSYLDWRKDGIPVGQLGKPRQLCQGLLSLVTNDFITGQILFVDGGESIAFGGRNAPAFASARSALEAVAGN